MVLVQPVPVVLRDERDSRDGPVSAAEVAVGSQEEEQQEPDPEF